MRDQHHLFDDEEEADALEQIDDASLHLQRICIDFKTARRAFEPAFLDFVGKYRSVLEASLYDADDPLEAYLDHVWPDGLPGSGIIANTRPHDSYLLRPPVEGPLAATFAARSVAPAFSLLEQSDRTLRAVGFRIAPHIEPRWFERTLSGLFIRTSRPSGHRLRAMASYLFQVADDPGMSSEDLQLLRALPPHRQATEKRLADWYAYLDWKEKLIGLDQISLRYGSWRWQDRKLEFVVRGPLGKRLSGKALMAVALSESESPEIWQQKAKRGPRGLELGEVVQAEPIAQKGAESSAARLLIEPSEDLLALLDAVDEGGKPVTLPIPQEGFLLSSIFGDLAPLLNQRRGIDRLRDDRSFAPRLADYLFNIEMALLPEPEAASAQVGLGDRLNARLNDDQLRAVQGALAAPDLFLIQGPPGTGKTTVIAELCYQVARQGGRVLVASQTNLAVDNALARLGNRPELRPLRIGDERRVGDEFKEFLQVNVVDRWFRGIRADCERRFGQREERAQRVLRVAEAIRRLNKIQEEYRRTSDELQQHQGELARVQSDFTAGHSRVQEYCEQARLALARAETLEQAQAWLGQLVPRPPLDILLQTAWGRELPTRLASLAPCPSFPNAQSVGGAVGRDLSGALRQIDWTARMLDAVEELQQTTSQATALLEGRNDAAREEQSAQLESLLEERRRLAESEEEQEVRRLAQVNREIKRLRGHAWSEICRRLSLGLAQVWGDDRPAALQSLISSLEPHARHEAVLNELGAWLTAVVGWQSLFRAACVELAKAANEEALSQRQQESVARAEAAAVAERCERLAAKLRTLEEHGTELRQQQAAHEGPWQEAWTSAQLPQASSSTTPWPPDARHSEQAARQFAAWREENAGEAERHRRWRSIQEDWLGRLRAPSEADRAHLTDLYVAHSNVVGLTCNEAGKRTFFEKDTFRPFNVVIIDEVSKATPPELLLPMLLGEKAILVGDHRQLPPMFREREDSYHEAVESGALAREDFERFKTMVTSSLFGGLFESAPEELKAALWTQYRMHPQVMRAVNYFYAGKLLPGPDEATLEQKRAHRLQLADQRGGLLLEPHQHILWIDSSQDEAGRPAYEQQVGSSKQNELEARIVGRLLHLLDGALRQQGYAARPETPFVAGSAEVGMTTQQWLSRSLRSTDAETLSDLLSLDTIWLNGRPTRGDDVVRANDELRIDPRKPIGVISFYGKQLGLLRRQRDAFLQHLARSRSHTVLDVRMDTVDRFQGMERPIVIVSLVRAVKHLHAGEFVRDFRRINVALSRAQALLIIVGAKRTFEQALVELPETAGSPEPHKEAVYRSIFEHAARCGGMRDAAVLPRAPWEVGTDASPWPGGSWNERGRSAPPARGPHSTGKQPRR